MKHHDESPIAALKLLSILLPKNEVGRATDYPSDGSAVKFTDRYIKNLKPESERYER